MQHAYFRPRQSQENVRCHNSFITAIFIRHIVSQEDAKLQYEKAHLEEELNSIQKQEQTINLVVAEANRTIRAITAIKSGENSSFMMPLGSGVTVKASIATGSNVLTSVGSGVVIEMDADNAINHLEMQITEQTALLNQVLVYKTSIVSALNQISARLVEMSKSQSPPSGK